MKLLKTLLIFLRLKVKETWKLLLIIIFILGTLKVSVKMIKPLYRVNTYLTIVVDRILPSDNFMNFENIKRDYKKTLEKNNRYKKIDNYKFITKVGLFIFLIASLCLLIILIVGFYPSMLIIAIILIIVVFTLLDEFITWLKDNWKEAKRLSELQNDK